MKKMFTSLSFLLATGLSFAQSADANQVVLGIAPFSKTSKVEDSHKSELEGRVMEEATSLKGLKVVPRSTQVLEQIAKEKNIQTQGEWLNAEVLAEAGKQLGATYLLTGDVAKVSIEKKTTDLVKDPLFHRPLKATFITIVVTLNIINVTTGSTDVTKEISNGPFPIISVSDEKAVSKTIKKLADQFNAFLDEWFKTKTVTH